MRIRERRRADILAIAAALFAEKGYDNTSIQDILDQLGKSKGSFYHHFRTKFDVLAAIAQSQATMAHTRYLDSAPENALDALNCLLCQASMLDSSIPLLKCLSGPDGGYEGAALLSVLQNAVQQEFFSAFQAVLLRLNRAGQAIYADESNARIAFQGFLAGCALLLREAGNTPPGSAQANTRNLLAALRRQMEAALGMLPGTVVILEYERLSKLLQALPSAGKG